MVGDSLSGVGRGGMITKLRAGKLASRSGAGTVIAAGREENVIPRLFQGEDLGTFLIPDQTPIQARKRWLAGQLKPKGHLTLDEGAAKVLKESGKSLLPIGVTQVEGIFERGDLVACTDPQGHEIARGLSNYGSDDARRLVGQPSHKIEEILGYVDEPELIHRDNLVVT